MKILDCAGGASSFTSTLINNGFDAKTVDVCMIKILNL